MICVGCWLDTTKPQRGYSSRNRRGEGACGLGTETEAEPDAVSVAGPLAGPLALARRSASSSAQSCAPFAGRSRESLLSIRAISSERPSGTPGRKVCTGGTSRNRICAKSAERCLAKNVGLPVKHSCTMQPRENRSARGSMSRIPLACSGDM